MDNYTEFHGEFIQGICVDDVLRNYFPDYNYKGIFFDVGAFEPVRISNSYHFEKNGWDVYCFEANTNLIPLLKLHRKNIFNYAIYDENKEEVEFNIVESGIDNWTAGFSAIELNEDISKVFPCVNKKITTIKIPQKTLNHILETELNNVKNIDILQIDIEGGELKCLYGLDLNKYQPKIILVENIMNDPKIYNYLSNFGYILDKHISYNQFYVKKEI